MALASHNQEERYPRAKFPPVLKSIDFVGEVKEDDGLRYSRNIGCSSLLGGSPIFLFGDTFISEPQPCSQFLGIASSTASMGSLSNPISTHYPSSMRDNEEHRRHRIPNFIPFRSDENQHNFSASSNFEQRNDRFYLCVCSSVIEIPSEPGVGVVWFIKGKTNDNLPINDSYYGIGIAEVEMKKVDISDGEFGEMMPVAKRHGDVIFDRSNPQWGNVATLLDKEFIYLYGTYHEVHLRHLHRLRKKSRTNIVDFKENPVFLCRVPHADKAYLFPEKYTYWNGESFVSGPSYLTPPPTSGARQTKSLNLEPVMYNIQCATIFYTNIFSNTEKGLFVLVGCNKSGDGKVRFKISDNPWGPWRGEGWLIDLKNESRENKDAKSCVYAHLWASDLDKGEMVLTWAESWPGGIGMARIEFEMVANSDGEDEDGQTNFSDDSMFSDVEERLFQKTYGKPVHKVEVVEDDYEIELNNSERREAWRKTLAKLCGYPDDDYQDKLPYDEMDYGILPKRKLARVDIPKSGMFENSARSGSPAGFKATDHNQTRGYREDENREHEGRFKRPTDRRGTWYLESVSPENQECKKEEMNGKIGYIKDIWYTNDEENEEGILEGCNNQTPGTWKSDNDTSTTQRYSFCHSQDLRVTKSTIENFSQLNIDPEDGRETPTVTHAPGIALRNPTHSDAFTAAPFDVDLISPISSQQQPLQKHYQHQERQPRYPNPHNYNSRPDKEIGMRALTEGRRNGYEGGGYVTNLNNKGHITRFSPQSWTESWHEALERDEHQQSTPLDPMRKWFYEKLLKGGIQKMRWTKETEVAPVSKEQKGLKKRFSETNLRPTGKNLVNFHKKLGKSEVNLQRFSSEQFPSMV